MVCSLSPAMVQIVSCNDAQAHLHEDPLGPAGPAQPGFSADVFAEQSVAAFTTPARVGQSALPEKRSVLIGGTL
mgnify:CR=1 FL=1